MTTPTQRSKAFLKDNGWEADIAEKWIEAIKCRKDLFNFIDLIAMHPEARGVLAIQTTSGPHVADHLQKYRTNELTWHRIWIWLHSGNRFEIWGWRKTGPRGKRKLWKARRLVLHLEDGKVLATDCGNLESDTLSACLRSSDSPESPGSAGTPTSPETMS